jgi:hypothetical protein
MLSFRYVLRLRAGGDEDVVRHVSYARLEQGQTISVAGRGEWIVRELVTSDDAVFNDGVAYCEPAVP